MPAPQRSAKARTLDDPTKLDLHASLDTNVIDWQAEKATCTADIIHWFDDFVWTYDPRLIGKPGGAYVRFKLWPKQRETVLWLLERIRAIEEGLIEKSRDAGATYLTAGVALHQWLFNPGFKATFGSRKVDYVDKKDNPDSIFAKIRIMLRRLPPELLPAGFSWTQHALQPRNRRGHFRRGRRGYGPRRPPDHLCAG